MPSMGSSQRVSKRYYGSDAVNQAAQYYGQKIIDPIAAHIIQEEGFVPGVYDDSKGIPTEGVGLTGEFVGKNFFTEVMPVFHQRASKAVKGYNTLPDEGKSAVLSAVYRGDLGPKTAKLLSAGKYEAAAKEYLNHAEYRQGKGKKATSAQRAISERMERNAQVFKSLAGDRTQ